MLVSGILNPMRFPSAIQGAVNIFRRARRGWQPRHAADQPRQPAGDGVVRCIQEDSSWPGLTRPSTSLFPSKDKEDVDARHKGRA
jgi:hypothetical protein